MDSGCGNKMILLSMLLYYITAALWTCTLLLHSTTVTEKIYTTKDTYVYVSLVFVGVYLLCGECRVKRMVLDMTAENRLCSANTTLWMLLLMTHCASSYVYCFTRGAHSVANINVLITSTLACVQCGFLVIIVPLVARMTRSVSIRTRLAEYDDANHTSLNAREAMKRVVRVDASMIEPDAYNAENTCPICITSLRACALDEQSKGVVQLTCGHMCCHDCIVTYWESYSTDRCLCPLCRTAHATIDADDTSEEIISVNV